MKFEKSLESCKAPHGNVTNFVGSVQGYQSDFQSWLCSKITNSFDKVGFVLESIALEKLIKIYLLLNEGRRFPAMAEALNSHFAKLDASTSVLDTKSMPDSLLALLDKVAEDLLSFIKKYRGLDEIYKNQNGGSFFCPKQRCQFLALKLYASSKKLKVAWITVDFSEQIANELIVNAKRDNALQQKILYLLKKTLGKNNFAGFGVIEDSKNDGTGLHCHIILAMNPEHEKSLRMELKRLVDITEKTAINISLGRKTSVASHSIVSDRLSINDLPIDIGAADYIVKDLRKDKKIFKANRILMFNTALFAGKEVLSPICAAFETMIKRLRNCFNLPGCIDPKELISKQIISLFFNRYSKFSSA